MQLDAYKNFLNPSVSLIQHHASGLIALDKPSGIRAHPNQRGMDARALLKAPYDAQAEAYRLENGESLFLLNRLDAPTSGIIALATSEALATAAKAAFAERSTQKTYLALLKGSLPPKAAQWRDRLQVQRQGSQLRVTAGSGHLRAETHIQPLPTVPATPPVTLVQMQPITGRTHQLRVQSAQRRSPIIGDATYGDFAFNRHFARQHGEKRLFLHAWKLVLTLSHAGKNWTWEVAAPIPEAFARWRR